MSVYQRSICFNVFAEEINYNKFYSSLFQLENLQHKFFTFD